MYSFKFIENVGHKAILILAIRFNAVNNDVLRVQFFIRTVMNFKY